MAYFFQSLVIGLVAGSNAYLHWTPNGYLAGFIGVGCAYLLTLIYVWIRTRCEQALQRHRR